MEVANGFSCVIVHYLLPAAGQGGCYWWSSAEECFGFSFSVPSKNVRKLTQDFLYEIFDRFSNNFFLKYGKAKKNLN